MRFTIHKHHLCTRDECLQKGIVITMFRTSNCRAELLSVGIQDVNNIVVWSKEHIEDIIVDLYAGGVPELYRPDIKTFKIATCCTGSTLYGDWTFIGTVIDSEGYVFHVFLMEVK